MSKQTSRATSRRHFIATTAAAVTIPILFPGCATHYARRKSPNNRINVGIVGYGWQGESNTKPYFYEDDCRVIAVCDVDSKHLAEGVKAVNDHYENTDCASYHDYRELMAREDLDAVVLSLPDHWHELVATEAARRKLDIYGEKPLAKTIAEQQCIVRAVQDNDVIWQTGSWQRSRANFRKAVEIVRNGLIGRVTRVEVGMSSGHKDFADTKEFMTPTEPPPELDYDMWIGPSAMQPYIKARIHKNWRWNYNTGGGQLLDWVGHHLDIAHWGLNFDRTGPYEVEGVGEFPPKDAVWNTCTRYRVELKYPGGVTMTMAGGHGDIQTGTKWIGDEGWVYVSREKFEASNDEWKKMKQLPDAQRKAKVYTSSNHTRNFLDCIRSRKPTITPVETAHNSAVPGHLGLISMFVGRKIRWDAKREVIIDDPEASKLMTREYRAPWKMS